MKIGFWKWNEGQWQLDFRGDASNNCTLGVNDNWVLGNASDNWTSKDSNHNWNLKVGLVTTRLRIPITIGLKLSDNDNWDLEMVVSDNWTLKDVGNNWTSS